MIGVLSDAHGNRPAFDTAIDLLRCHGASRFVFLGDAVGYIPIPHVISAIQDLGGEIICIRGNHEDRLLTGSFDPLLDEVYQHAKTRTKMSEAGLDFIMQWPTQCRIELEVGKVLFVHGSPHDPTCGYVYPDTDLSKFTVNEEAFIFMGHTHYPFIRKHEDKTFINVGSCGLPRDYGSLGAVGLFDERSGNVRILRFDITKQIEQTLASVRAVHPSVAKIFHRKPKSYEGELSVVEK